MPRSGPQVSRKRWLRPVTSRKVSSREMEPATQSAESWPKLWPITVSTSTPQSIQHLAEDICTERRMQCRETISSTGSLRKMLGKMVGSPRVWQIASHSFYDIISIVYQIIGATTESSLDLLNGTEEHRSHHTGPLRLSPFDQSDRQSTEPQGFSLCTLSGLTDVCPSCRGRTRGFLCRLL